jgi:23S rRNA pseudouridine1911/1915/1917 synthase
VIDKPAGLVVHPAGRPLRTGTLVNALIAHCGASLSGIGGVQATRASSTASTRTRAACMVVAKTDKRPSSA